MYRKKILLYPLMLCFAAIVCTVAVGAYSRMSCVFFMIDYANIDTSDADLSLLDGFTDIPEDFSERPKKYLAVALEKGIVRGFEDNTLRLDQDVTRAEFSCFIYRTKDYFTPPTELVTYQNAYTDIADWHRTETVYCIENGFLIGYGDSFGSNDLISREQVKLVAARIKYGLSTREKYTMLEIFNSLSSPFSMGTILYTAYDPALAALVPPMVEDFEHEKGYTNENDPTNLAPAPSSAYTLTDPESHQAERERVAVELIDLLESLQNLDAARLADPDYRNHFADKFRIPYLYDDYLYTTIYINDKRTYINAVFDAAAASGTKRESIFALAPQNCRAYTDYMGGIVSKRDCGAGYEYFCYQSEGGLPEGLAAGVWYRRTVSVNYESLHRNGYGRYLNLYITFGEPEPISEIGKIYY